MNKNVKAYTIGYKNATSCIIPPFCVMQVIFYEIDPSFLWLSQNMTTDFFKNFVKYVVTLSFWCSKHVNVTSIS